MIRILGTAILLLGSHIALIACQPYSPSTSSLESQIQDVPSSRIDGNLNVLSARDDIYRHELRNVDKYEFFRHKNHIDIFNFDLNFYKHIIYLSRNDDHKLSLINLLSVYHHFNFDDFQQFINDSNERFYNDRYRFRHKHYKCRNCRVESQRKYRGHYLRMLSYHTLFWYQHFALRQRAG
ncbi:hypothetical protein F1880_001693 [Penicillium rolfsii]|nr:hypothetical protein F1880_001693 [Penicillium rolfsii]